MRLSRALTGTDAPGAVTRSPVSVIAVGRSYVCAALVVRGPAAVRVCQRALYVTPPTGAESLSSDDDPGHQTKLATTRRRTVVTPAPIGTAASAPPRAEKRRARGPCEPESRRPVVTSSTSCVANSSQERDVPNRSIAPGGGRSAMIRRRMNCATAP